MHEQLTNEISVVVCPVSAMPSVFSGFQLLSSTLFLSFARFWVCPNHSFINISIVGIYDVDD
jgi:hypothetical protein